MIMDLFKHLFEILDEQLFTWIFGDIDQCELDLSKILRSCYLFNCTIAIARFSRYAFMSDYLTDLYTGKSKKKLPLDHHSNVLLTC